MIIERKLSEEVLAAAMSTGADFAEIYAELTYNDSVHLIDRKVDQISNNVLSGAGIRAFVGTRTVFASTSDLTREGLLRCARAVAAAIGEGKESISICLTERMFPNIHPARIIPSSVATRVKTDILKSACSAAYDYDGAVSQVTGTLLGVDHTIQIANSEGLLTTDRHVRTRLAVSAVASKNGENQQGYYAPGRGMGLEVFDMIDPVEVGKTAAAQAMVNLRADYCPAGQMTVAIENGFGGVIFHEACGHSLEATSVAIGMSEMAGKLGQQIANPKVTAIDDGTIPGAWGSVNIDDEGNPTQQNVLIENGVLKSYMVDRLGSRRMGLPMTGNSRRQSYQFEPTSRMTNTYIANGPDRNEDIIASIEYGLYAKSMGGGSVDPLTGAFNFSVNEGYIIRKACTDVRAGP